MNFLYGDSTSSPLKSNFLEFLRDAMDFSVFALQADDRIQRGKDRIIAASADAEKELQRLDRFIAAVSRTIDDGEKGAGDSPASHCAARLTALVADAHRATATDLSQRLAETIAQIDAEEAASRTACRGALATLLAPHDLHDATSEVRLTLRKDGTYEAKLIGCASFGLEWTFALDVPDANMWRAPVRLDAVVQHLEVRAPQLTGWLSKEVKIRPQKLDRHVVTKLVDDGAIVSLELRPEPGVDVGFDVEVDRSSAQVKMTRIGPAEDGSVGTFDVHADDAPALIALAEKLHATSTELKRGTLLAATVGGEDFEARPTFAELVKRMVTATAPIVREISDRSLTPNELVLRRLLANDRREEIFVPKATLREKYAVLPKALAEVFAPLGFDRTERTMPNLPAVPVDEPRRLRAQLAPSQPPPPPAPPSRAKSEPAPRVLTVRPPLSSSAAVPPPASPPAGASANEAIDAPPIELSADDVIPASRESSNELLMAALKKIAHLTRNGRTDEAYDEYAELYTSQPFADYRPDEQRQALRLMILPKTPPPTTSPAVVAAHNAAILRLQSLVAALKEPADYELLGVASVVVADPGAAATAFQAGLECERARNPQSELCGTLMRRLSAI